MTIISLLPNVHIRVVKAPDGQDLLSLYDCLEAGLVTKAKNRFKAARVFWRDTLESNEPFKLNVTPFLLPARFPEQRGSAASFPGFTGPESVGLTVAGLQHVAECLAPKFTPAFRRAVLDFTRGYFTGDRSMLAPVGVTVGSVAESMDEDKPASEAGSTGASESMEVDGDSNTLCFSELIAGASVRVTRINGVVHMSIRDIIMVVTSKDANHSAQTWRESPESFKNEVNQSVVYFQFPGRGQSVQPVITFEGALKLVMWLPGDGAKDYRSAFCDILKRYYAGDPTLVPEIHANAASEAPLHKMAQEACAQDPAFQARIEQQLREMQEKLNLAPMLATLQAELYYERNLRHKSDGRLGGEVRAATQVVRRQAEYWQASAEKKDANMKEIVLSNNALIMSNNALTMSNNALITSKDAVIERLAAQIMDLQKA